MKFSVSGGPAFALLVSVVVATVVAISSKPAAAAITGAQWTSGTSSYAGACPVSVTFTGTITGSPGTAFQYSFNRFINGVQQLQNEGARVIPATGSFAVSDTINISATTGANTFDQIYVWKIPGQPDVYSNKANFSVTCGTPGAQPSPSPTSRSRVIRSLAFITPPVLSMTHDPSDCARHVSSAEAIFVGMSCKGALDKGEIILIWDWTQQNPCPTAMCKNPAGYHVYQVNPSTRMARSGGVTGQRLVDTSGSDVTLSTPASGKCYAVTGFNGPDESALSNTVCAGTVAAGSALQRSFLKPVHFRVAKVEKEHNSVGLKAAMIGEANFSNDLVVGYEYLAFTEALGDEYRNTFWRSALQFDLTPFHGHTISQALLHLQIDQSYYQTVDGPQTQDNGRSCIVEIGTGAYEWWSQSEGVPIVGDFSDAINTGSQRGPSLAYDVTALAQAWSEGATNRGVVLRNTDENLNAFTNADCLTAYSSNVLLEVDHY